MDEAKRIITRSVDQSSSEKSKKQTRLELKRRVLSYMYLACLLAWLARVAWAWKSLMPACLFSVVWFGLVG